MNLIQLDYIAPHLKTKDGMTLRSIPLFFKCDHLMSRIETTLDIRVVNLIVNFVNFESSYIRRQFLKGICSVQAPKLQNSHPKNSEVVLYFVAVEKKVI